MNPPRHAALGLLWLLSAAPAAAQEKQDKPEIAITPLGEVRVLSDKEAAKLKTRLKNLVLSKKAKRKSRRKRKKGGPPKPSNFVTRLEEVEALMKVQHRSLVPILKNVILKDPQIPVRAKGASAMLAQPRHFAVPAAITLLKESRVQREGNVSAPLIRLLSHYGTTRSVWKELRGDFLRFGTVAKIALLQSIGERRDWDGLDLLLRHMDEPAPANVDDPSNPPASYWEQRWKDWQKFKPHLMTAVGQLLGKSFSSRKEAEEWIASQGGLRKIRKKRGG
ncbi:MAG: hypothetical protein ACE5F1_01215 [Planctomycetota bacterium]